MQVLRLMLLFELHEVAGTVCNAIDSTIGFDAVKNLLLCLIEWYPPLPGMTIYPDLPKATVSTTSARSYM